LRIVPGQSIAGVDLVGVRDALRRLKDHTFPAASVTDRFDLDPDPPGDSSMRSSSRASSSPTPIGTRTRTAGG